MQTVTPGKLKNSINKISNTHTHTHTLCLADGFVTFHELYVTDLVQHECFVGNVLYWLCAFCVVMTGASPPCSLDP